MNSRNIYCLGNFPSKRRKSQADPFERDPFKVQSYNFHYADRPSYPVNILAPKPERPDCQTYFYNYDFTRSNHNKLGQVPVSKFQETRRKQFLQDLRPNRTSLTLGNTKEMSFNNKQNIGNKNRSHQYNNTDIFKPSTQENTRKAPISPNLNQNLTVNGNNFSNGINTNSGCEINIKIKNSTTPDNVNIKIETDSISRNLNLPLKNSMPNVYKLHINSSDSLMVNKKFSRIPSNSKFQVNNFRKSESERVKELTALYSSQNLQKPFRCFVNKSNDRLPSLIPFKMNNSSFSKENLYPKKTWSHKQLDQLKVYDNKATSSGFNQSPYNSASGGRGGGPKLLNTYNNSNKFNNARQPPLVSSLHSLPNSKHKMDLKAMGALRLRSKTQVPLNVNINVYATDNLKLIR